MQASSARARAIVRYARPDDSEDSSADGEEEQPTTAASTQQQQQQHAESPPSGTARAGGGGAAGAGPARSSLVSGEPRREIKAGPAAVAAAAAAGALGLLSAAVMLLRRRARGKGKKSEQRAVLRTAQDGAGPHSSSNGTAKRRKAGASSSSAAATAAAAAPGPLSKLKPSAMCVPTADGTLAVVKRPIAADNSCLFNAVGYTMHQSLSRAPFLRRVVSNEVSGDPEKWGDAFLGMPNASYCAWIADPHNWGGGIELAILAAHYRREIYAWNVETGEAHVFGEDAGHARCVMVLYNGVHYDALAVTPSPQASKWDDDVTEFKPRTKRGRMILEAARALVALNGGKSRTSSRAGNASVASSCSAGGAAASSGKSKQRRATNKQHQQPSAASGAAQSLGRLRCADCSSMVDGPEAAKEHAATTGHNRFEQVE